MNIGIVGMGLIGGSLARTIKLQTKHRVYAVDIDPETIAQAKLLDAMDEELTDENMGNCDMIFVALYPQAIIDWVTGHSSLIKKGAIVVDCGGVKQMIVDALSPVAREHGWHFIGGHPMAGREFSGFRYTKDDMFENASMVLTPDPDEPLEILQELRNFFMDIGFRKVQFTTPQNHDEMIAYTSQLAHVLSSAYVKCPRARNHKGFSAGSFADMTRVARLNETMWTELFFANRDPLLLEVQGLIDNLTAYRDALQNNDKDAMFALLKEGREIKEFLTEK